jgi:hypothetical protein
MERKQQYRRMFNEVAAMGHLVPDIVTEQSTFLFLLESPHVEELKHGAPVSGSSGCSMTKHLYGERYKKYALGILIKKNRDEALDRPSLNMVGLMNVCQIPLQVHAYSDGRVRSQYAPLFKVLEGVRKENNQLVYPDPDWNVVQEIIVESLRRKLDKLTDRNLVIVPCGRFAQKFFRLANIQSTNWKVIAGVPHPSRDGWDKSQYAAAIDAMKQQFAISVQMCRTER